jgi:rSAM/selenodomain-associated transferase 1
MHLIVIAKEPVPGRVKTRLCPPCTPEQAASIAAAALADTLEAVAHVPGVDPIVAFDGEPRGWVPRGMPVVGQRGVGLGARLAAAFDDVGGPALLIGMDTPQVTPALLEAACDRLEDADVDAVLGPACDGGWWAIGLMTADPSVFIGVPMSTDRTLDRQRSRLRARSLSVVELPTMRDVDLPADALAVAREASGPRFAAAVAASPIGSAIATMESVG